MPECHGEWFPASLFHIQEQLARLSEKCLETSHRALGGTRTPNLLIRSQMLYPLSYKREWVLPRQLPYLIRFATRGLGVVRGGDERI